MTAFSPMSESWSRPPIGVPSTVLPCASSSSERGATRVAAACISIRSTQPSAAGLKNM
jgi:hypothetical protein